MKARSRRVLGFLAALLTIGAVLATSTASADATSTKASTSTKVVVVASKMAASSATTADIATASDLASAKCTTFWCEHPYCHTYYCWHTYCHTWYCTHNNHMPPYGKHFCDHKGICKQNSPSMAVASTALKQGGSLSLSVMDVSRTVRISLVGKNKAAISLGSFKANTDGMISRAVKLPAGLSGSYSLIATDMSTKQTSSMALYIAPKLATVKTATTSKLASASIPSSQNTDFSLAAVIGLGVLSLGMLGSGSTMLFLGRRRRSWKARA